MKKYFIFTGVLFLLVSVLILIFVSPLIVASPYTVSEKPRPFRIIESFSKYKVGDFPKSLRTYPFQRGQAKKIYKVEEENENRFLRAYDDQDISVQVMRQFYWDIEKYPWVSWKWRPRVLPTNGDERFFKDPGSRNDSACGIYIIFGKYSGKAIKYVWSTGAPVGHIVKKNPNKFHIVIQESGPAKDTNAWHRVAINVPDDYKKNFEEELKKNPTGIGMLTDGNALHVTSSCDYDDLTISDRKPF